jgi:hypothetical protein
MPIIFPINLAYERSLSRRIDAEDAVRGERDSNSAGEHNQDAIERRCSELKHHGRLCLGDRDYSDLFETAEGY